MAGREAYSVAISSTQSKGLSYKMTGFSETSRTPKKVGLREQNPEKSHEGGPGCRVTQEAVPSLGRAAEQCASMLPIWGILLLHQCF